MTSHPVKKSELGGKIKLQYGIMILSVSKMPIFHNQPDNFNVLFGQDKQNFIFFLVISVFLKNRAISYSKTCCFEGLFVTKCCHFFVAEFHRSHCLPGNDEFYVSCTQLKYPILLGKHYTNRKAQWQCSRHGRT